MIFFSLFNITTSVRAQSETCPNAQWKPHRKLSLSLSLYTHNSTLYNERRTQHLSKRGKVILMLFTEQEYIAWTDVNYPTFLTIQTTWKLQHQTISWKEISPKTKYIRKRLAFQLESHVANPISDKRKLIFDLHIIHNIDSFSFVSKSAFRVGKKKLFLK